MQRQLIVVNDAAEIVLQLRKYDQRIVGHWQIGVTIRVFVLFPVAIPNLFVLIEFGIGISQASYHLAER